MNKKKINELIIQYIPDIKDNYEKEKTEVWGKEEIGPSIVLEDMVMRPVFEALEKEMITDFVINVFKGIENLISLNNAELNVYLDGAVFENISLQNVEITDKCISLLGPLSLSRYKSNLISD